MVWVEESRNPPSSYKLKRYGATNLSIIAIVVARIGFSKMIGTWELSSMSRTKNLHGMRNLPMWTGTSSNIPTDRLMELSAHCLVKLVGCRSYM